MVDWFRVARAQLALTIDDVTDQYPIPSSYGSAYDSEGRLVRVKSLGTTVEVSVAEPAHHHIGPVHLSVDLRAPVRDITLQGLSKGVPRFDLSTVTRDHGRVDTISREHESNDQLLTFLIQANTTGYITYLEFTYSRGQLRHRYSHTQSNRIRKFYRLTSTGYACLRSCNGHLNILPPGRDPKLGLYQLPVSVSINVNTVETINQYGFHHQSKDQQFYVHWYPDQPPTITQLTPDGEYRLSEQFLLQLLDNGIHVQNIETGQQWFADRRGITLSRTMIFDQVHNVVLVVVNSFGIIALPVVNVGSDQVPTLPTRNTVYHTSPYIQPTTVAIPPTTVIERIRATFDHITSQPKNQDYFRRESEFYNRVYTDPNIIALKTLETIPRPVVNRHWWLPERQMLIVEFNILHTIEFQAYIVRFADR